MTTPNILVFQEAKTRRHDDLALCVFPERILGPEGSLHHKQMALVSNILATMSVENVKSRDIQAFFAHPWTFPEGSVLVASRKAIKAMSPRQPYTNVVLRDLRVHVGQESWKQVNFASSTMARQDIDGKSPYWDLLAVGVVLGVIKEWGATPRVHALHKTHHAYEHWMAFVVAACLRVLKPWLGNGAIPIRGNGSRPFPLTCSLERANHDAYQGLFNGPGVNNGLGWLRAWLKTGILVGNTPYDATHFVPGPSFEDAVAKFPADVVAAGQRIAQVISPSVAENIEVSTIMTQQFTQIMSAHEKLQTAQLLTSIDHLRVEALPAYARRAPKKTKR